MGWSAPHLGVSITASQPKRKDATQTLSEAFVYGLNIGKSVFRVVAVNPEGAVIQRAKFARKTLQSFCDPAAKALIAMKACPGSQWFARKLIEKGHGARIPRLDS
ncbi:hypothetical protein [Cypionkella sp. TWP1-2-1b2]|uniref:hypothetical protein n=1 Tax=Cypionkella sp. TWP1-2-1b2 TaxID=2804675 RepID=UPI003CF4C21C